MNAKVEAYLSGLKKWRDELEQVREILLECGLGEELKWRAPCYTYQGGNIAIIGELKACCVLSFFKGSLLKDPEGILTKPGENSRAARVIRFTSVPEIVELAPVLKAYIHQAIEVEKAGLKVDFEESGTLPLPRELQDKFNELPPLRAAFEALTPGRQRGYVLHFSAPKQSQTRESRIEKCSQRILDGKGLNDCTCGLSQKLPYCDGSHKNLR